MTRCPFYSRAWHCQCELEAGHDGTWCVSMGDAFASGFDPYAVQRSTNSEEDMSKKNANTKKLPAKPAPKPSPILDGATLKANEKLRANLKSYKLKVKELEASVARHEAGPAETNYQVVVNELELVRDELRAAQLTVKDLEGKLEAALGRPTEAEQENAAQSPADAYVPNDVTELDPSVPTDG